MATGTLTARHGAMHHLFETAEAVLFGSFNLLTPMLRHWRTHWGTRHDEATRSLPGDALVPSPRWQSTRALTIRARPGAVWPWLVQIGEGRAGLYSYEFLERMAGCKIQNADAILPEYQSLQVGEGIRLHPKIPALPVTEIVPEKYLLLGSKAEYNEAFKAAVGVTWLFYLEAQADDSTRLIVRWRSWYPLTTGLRLAFGPLFIEPIHFTMEQKMLRGLRVRAETVARK